MNDATNISSLLPLRTARTLVRAGIDTIEQIQASYPETLLSIEGFGITSLRAVEAAFFPDQRFDPKARKCKRSRTRSIALSWSNLFGHPEN